jgi:hypothetical protein
MAKTTPAETIRKAGIKVVAGMTLDPAKLGIPAHPDHGPFPVLKVTKAKEDGKGWLEGEIDCTKCGKGIHLHPGDWFQVRTCKDCKKGGKKAKGAKVVKAAKARTVKVVKGRKVGTR